jgi:hypothetical protein
MKKSRTLLTAVATFATLGISCTAFAAGLGGKADVGVGAGGGPDNRGAGAAVGVDAGGGVTAPPASASGAANSNGSISTDRDLGQDRAAERRSVEGQAHEKATDNVGKKKDKLRKPLPPDGEGVSPVK